MNDDNPLGDAQHACNLRLEVVERVSMFAKDDDLALTPAVIAHLWCVLEKLGQFFPLAVLTGGDQLLRSGFKRCGPKPNIRVTRGKVDDYVAGWSAGSMGKRAFMSRRKIPYGLTCA